MEVAEAWATAADEIKSLESLGFSGADLEIEVGILPENKSTVEVFFAMSTQWRSGMTGSTGLDYNALPAVFDLVGVKRKQRQEAFAGIRVMEGEALRALGEGREGKP